ncbi:MAG TPA: lipid A-modifier LpxR family protein [Thermohalobaculum sp.]|nr:lipid A-modifier LpxR family protein [Thermohalobaculum sp.]
MPVFNRFFPVALVAFTVAASAHAGESPRDASEGWEWLASINEIQTEGVFWNDSFGDGKDRWKSGGLTQAFVFPEHIFSNDNWFEGRASGLELNVRGLVMTPDNTASTRTDSGDRPFAQYAAVGIYLDSIVRPRALSPTVGLQIEDRFGVEAGWQGDPLPLFDIQNAVHGMTGTEGNAGNLSNSINGEVLVNLEARRTLRFHADGSLRDIEFAPFVQTSLGMRENSLRVGGDVFIGSALEGRTWGSDLATGAVMAGASMPGEGINWTFFAGGDLGYIASDAFLDGGFAGNGPRVERRDLVGRARVGVLMDYNEFSVGFSLNWLGEEFHGQSDGQVIGAIQLKYRF